MADKIFSMSVIYKPGIYGVEVRDERRNKNRFFECESQHFNIGMQKAFEVISKWNDLEL